MEIMIMATKQQSAADAKKKLRATFGAAATTAPAEDDFVPETHWLNIGFEDENGNFISISLGVPVSKLKPVKVPPSGEYRQIALQRNVLIKQILSTAQACESGDEFTLDGLEVRMRTVADQEPTATDEEIVLPFAINWGK